MSAEPNLLQRAARQLGAGPVLDRLGIEPAGWWEKQMQSAPAPNPSESQIGSMYMPAQTPVEPPREIAAHTRYEIPLGPGFPELPVWPQETWLLKSFEVQLSGSLRTQDPLSFTGGNEVLDVVLGLEQRGGLVWSNSLALPLVATTAATEGQEYSFTAAVFVDLVNGLPYRADAQLQWVISGLAPAFAIVPEPLDRFETETLEVQRESASSGAQTVEELGSVDAGIAGLAEGIGDVSEGVGELANGSTQQIELLEEIREKL
jgi:X-X-X-Leu-X-X-Gly heptad repeat protein